MIEYYEMTMDFAAKKTADLEGVLFGTEECAPSHSYGPTLRPYHLMHFVTKGTGRLETAGISFRVGAGDAFLIPAEQISYYEASAEDPWSYSWIGFTGIRSDDLVRRMLASSEEGYILRGIDTEKYAGYILTAAVLDRSDYYSHMLCESILYEIFLSLTEEVPGMVSIDTAPAVAARIKFYLDAKYMENMRMEEVADLFGIHPNHLSRVFRLAYRISPKQYLQKLKMEKAAGMLKASDIPVALVAESLGFEDQRIFSRAFRNYWGSSPSEYRSNYGAAENKDCRNPLREL